MNHLPLSLFAFLLAGFLHGQTGRSFSDPSEIGLGSLAQDPAWKASPGFVVEASGLVLPTEGEFRKALFLTPIQAETQPELEIEFTFCRDAAGPEENMDVVGIEFGPDENVDPTQVAVRLQRRSGGGAYRLAFFENSGEQNTFRVSRWIDAGELGFTPEKACGGPLTLTLRVAAGSAADKGSAVAELRSPATSLAELNVEEFETSTAFFSGPLFGAVNSVKAETDSNTSRRRVRRFVLRSGKDPMPTDAPESLPETHAGTVPREALWDASTEDGPASADSVVRAPAETGKRGDPAGYLQPNFPTLTATNPALEPVVATYNLAIHNIGRHNIFYDWHTSRPVFNAGADYRSNWTRDGGIVAWQAGSLIDPQVTRNSLLGRIKDGEVMPDGHTQRWDNVVWISAVWRHYLLTGDRALLEQAYPPAEKLIADRHAEFFVPSEGLYKCAAVFHDNTAAFPEGPLRRDVWYNVEDIPELVTKPGWEHLTEWGYVEPMKRKGQVPKSLWPGIYDVLSTSNNAVWADAYAAMAGIAKTLGKPSRAEAMYLDRAEALREAIQRELWLPEKGRYAYYKMGPDSPVIEGPDQKIHPGFVDTTYIELLCQAMPIAFGITPVQDRAAVFDSLFRGELGYPIVYPKMARWFEEYGENDEKLPKGNMGTTKHSYTVWPMASGYLGIAAAKSGRPDVLAAEILDLARLVEISDGNFLEVYHPDRGDPTPYHGRTARHHQTWSATGYLGMLYYGLAGIRVSEKGLRFEPMVPEGWGGTTEFASFRYRDAEISLTLRGEGSDIGQVLINGVRVDDAVIPADARGLFRVEIHLADSFGLSPLPLP